MAETSARKIYRRSKMALPFAMFACALAGTAVAVTQCQTSSATSLTQTSTANVVVSANYQYDQRRWREGLLGDKETVSESTITIVLCNTGGHTSGTVSTRIEVPSDCKIIAFAADPLFVHVDRDGSRRQIYGKFQQLRGSRKTLWLEIPTLPTDMQLAIAIALVQPVDRRQVADVSVLVHDMQRTLAAQTARHFMN